MTTHAHISYPFLLVYIANIWLKLPITWFQYLLIPIFALLPDIDIIYLLIRYGKAGVRGDINISHHDWFLHWPIIYVPIWLLTIIWPYWLLVIVSYSTLTHLIMDTLYGGIRWLTPLSSKKYNFQPEHLNELRQLRWLQAYRKLPIYIVDMIASAAVIIILVYELIRLV